MKFCKANFPAKCPVSIRRVKLSSKFDAVCIFKNNNFLIKINNLLPEHEAIEALIHEYAHVLSWDDFVDEEHCNEWGKAYSKIYRAFIKNF